MARRADEVLKTHEVADLFRVSTDTVYKWARLWEEAAQFGGPAVVLRTQSGQLRFRRKAIERMLQEGA